MFTMHKLQINHEKFDDVIIFGDDIIFDDIRKNKKI